MSARLSGGASAYIINEVLARRQHAGSYRRQRGLNPASDGTGGTGTWKSPVSFQLLIRSLQLAGTIREFPKIKGPNGDPIINYSLF